MAIKQFSKKSIEKLFIETYPQGELFKDNNTWCWTPDISKRTIHLYNVNNYYDLAESLHLASSDQIADMKKAAGYRSYQ